MDAKANTQVCTAFDPLSEDDTEIPTSSAFLIVVNGGIPGSMLRVDSVGTTLGRSAECTHQILDPTISRRHALFLTDARGGVHVTDLGSTNGTYVESERLAPGVPRRLADGERIQIGKSVVVKVMHLDAEDEKFHRELYERTVRDPLTGLYNRSYFLAQLTTVTHRTVSSGMGLAVMMLDVDHFKRVNDTYGHAAGDVVLRQVAEVLRESTRAEDLVARYGGEEFVAALPVRAPDIAAERAEKIRSSLAGRAIEINGRAHSVTASLGVIYNPPHVRRSDSHLIMMADQALYEAKSEGRDRVVFAHQVAQPVSSRTGTAEISVYMPPTGNLRAPASPGLI